MEPSKVLLVRKLLWGHSFPPKLERPLAVQLPWPASLRCCKRCRGLRVRPKRLRHGIFSAKQASDR